MAYTDREDLSYLGNILLAGQNRTPFLKDIVIANDGDSNPANVDMFGGMMSNIKTYPSFLYPMSQPYSLDSASQPAVTEASSVASQTASTTTRNQVTNTSQIFQETAEVSHAKLSAYGELGGVVIGGESNPIQNELAFQIRTKSEQIAIDMEYSFLNGTYQVGSDASTASKTRGIITASIINTVDASSAVLSVTLINTLLAEMVGNGANVDGCTIYVNSFQKIAIDALYSYAEQSRFQGGTTIQEIFTPFGRLGISFNPHVPAGTLLVADTRRCNPVFTPVMLEDGSNVLVAVERVAQVAASYKWQLYLQAGIDYSHAQFHGTLTSLATS